MLSESQINIVKDTLERVIYSIRVSEILQMVFTYYTDSNESDSKLKDPKDESHYNFDELKKQLKKHILTQRKEYFKLDETKAKFVEDLAINNSKEFDSFKEFVENAWTCDPVKQKERLGRGEREKQEKQTEKLKSILKDKYETHKEVVELILKDTSEYPYKSDKIKVLLELELDVDTIFYILQTEEKWASPKGYINKYFEERKQNIYNGKASLYDLDSNINYILKQLRSRN